MNILITADLHIHPHKRELARLEDGLKCLEWIYSVAKDNNCSEIIIAGDLFHDRNYNSNLGYAKACQIINNNKKNGINTNLLLGNHDMIYEHEDGWNLHSLITIDSCANLINKPCSQTIGDMTFDFLPYTPTPSKYLDQFDPPNEYLITHLSVANASLNSVYQNYKSVEEDIEGSELISAAAFKKWKKVFLGHFHVAQKINNVEYVGSPIQWTFGEANQDKHVIILDTETKEQKYVINNISPKFFVIEKEEDLKNIEIKNSYIRMSSDQNISNLFELRNKLSKAGVRNFDIKPIKKDIEQETAKAMENINTFFNDTNKLISDYVDNASVPESIDKDTLKTIGNQIISKD